MAMDSGFWSSWSWFTGGRAAAEREDSELNRLSRQEEKMVKSVLRLKTKRNGDLIQRLESNQETVQEWIAYLMERYHNRMHGDDYTEMEEGGVDFGTTMNKKLRDLKVDDLWWSAKMIELAETFEREGQNRDHEEIVMNWLNRLVTPPPLSPNNTERDFGCWSWCCFSGEPEAAENEDSDRNINVNSPPELNRYIQEMDKMLETVLGQETEQNRDLIERLKNNQETLKKCVAYLLVIHGNRNHRVDAETEIEEVGGNSGSNLFKEELEALKAGDPWLDENVSRLETVFVEAGEDRDQEDIVMEWLNALVTPPPPLRPEPSNAGITFFGPHSGEKSEIEEEESGSCSLKRWFASSSGKDKEESTESDEEVKMDCYLQYGK